MKIPVHGDLLAGQYSQGGCCGPVRPEHKKSSKAGNCAVRLAGLYL